MGDAESEGVMEVGIIKGLKETALSLDNMGVKFGRVVTQKTER